MILQQVPFRLVEFLEISGKNFTFFPENHENQLKIHIYPATIVAKVSRCRRWSVFDEVAHESNGKGYGSCAFARQVVYLKIQQVFRKNQ